MRLTIVWSIVAFAASAGGASIAGAPNPSQAMPPQPAPYEGRSGDDLRILADRTVGAGVAQAAAPRAIVAISLHGQRAFFGYSGTGDAPLTRDSVVEIGSITKVFTGTLLAEAFDRGVIDPNRSIQTYLPGVTLGPCTARITPLELSDFSSGLPELPDDAPKMLEQRGIQNYTPRDFLAWLASFAPRTGCTLPAPYLYSNASVGVLGPILANATGQPWQALVADHITRPLGMVDTAVAPSRAQVQGFAGTQPAVRWPVFAWYAAGALRSTAQDMLAFGEAALGHAVVNGRTVPPTLRQSFQNAMRPVYHKTNGGGVGLSWESQGDGSGGTMTYKAGGTAGFTTVVIVDPEKDCTIFVAANKGNIPVPQFGMRLMRAIGSQN